MNSMHANMAQRWDMRLTATSRGDADNECGWPPLPTFLITPWGRHYLYLGASPCNNAGVTLASHATRGRAGVGVSHNVNGRSVTVLGGS
jgi:hypothetical protein